MGTYQTLTVETHDRVAVVTFRRADQLNAMNRLMQAEITEAFESLSRDPEVGAIVVTGDGRGFMAGADIKEYAAQTGAEFDAFQAAGTRMYASIEENAKPVIAAVNGFALGGGMELVLCCDIVLANQYAKLGLPEIKLGLVPGGGGTQRSVARLGRNRANMLLLTGAIVPASEFVAAGLVNEIVDVEALLPRAMELARSIAAEPAAAIEGLKRLSAHAMTGDLEEGLAMERRVLGGLYRSEIGQTRIRGIEATFNGQVTDWLNVFGGYTHLDPKIVDGGYTALSVAANGPAKATTVQVVSVNTGKQVPQTAKDTFTLWATVTAAQGLSIGGGAFYSSRVFGGYADNRSASQDAAGVIMVKPATKTLYRYVPEYWRFDARIAYRFDPHWEVALNVQNLTNKAYFNQVYTSHYASIAPGRSAFATLNFKY